MNLYSEKFMRNPLSRSQQKRIRETTFAIVGLGGTGGFILENLIRTGAESFLLFEHDRFELSNFNRQILATEEFIDMPKTQAAISRAKSINPDATIRLSGRFEADSDLGGADVLIDGADNVITKLGMARAARREKIPYVFCGANDSRGIVSVFTDYLFEKAFQLDARLEKYGVCSTILCPSVSLAGTIAAAQALNHVIGKPYTKAPKAVFYDLFRKDPFWIGELG